jgi:hypothetical protein
MQKEFQDIIAANYTDGEVIAATVRQINATVADFPNTVEADLKRVTK